MLKQRPVGRGYNYGVFMCKMKPSSKTEQPAPLLFQDVDVLLGADLFQDLRPHAYGDFAKMRLAQQEH